MLPTILGIAVIGLICGLLLLHWLTLAFVSLGVSIACVLISPWDWLLVPKWFGLLSILQFAYLAGALIKVLAEDADSRESEPVVRVGQDVARQRRAWWLVRRRRGAPPQPAVRA